MEAVLNGRKKVKDFTFLTFSCRFTDDSMMTLAIAETHFGIDSKLGERAMKFLLESSQSICYAFSIVKLKRNTRKENND